MMIIRQTHPSANPGQKHGLAGPPQEFADSEAFFREEFVQAKTEYPGFLEFAVSSDGSELIARIQRLDSDHQPIDVVDRVIAVCESGGPFVLPTKSAQRDGL